MERGQTPRSLSPKTSARLSNITRMEIGIYGLGRMGANMARRLIKNKHRVIVYNRTAEKTKELAKEGAIGSYSLDEFLRKLKSPKLVWLMLPSGEVTAQAIDTLKTKLKKGDILIDGGNSRYKDSIKHGELLAKYGIHFMDAGTSGGIWGLKVGYCLMIGGEKVVFQKLEPIFKSLAPKNGYLHCGPHGAGHFVKMIHNGIEYGMMQSIGEGFQLLHDSQFELNLQKIASLWNQGSVVRSWLMELAERAFQAEGNDLKALDSHIDDSGEGRWTILESIERGVPTPVLATSLYVRFLSQQKDFFSGKVISALRREFGGHSVKTKNG